MRSRSRPSATFLWVSTTALALTAPKLHSSCHPHPPYMGYVSANLESVSAWSDRDLEKELGKINDDPGYWRGDINVTRPQREAYNIITEEIFRRENRRKVSAPSYAGR